MTPNATLQRVSPERIQQVTKLYQEGVANANIQAILHMTFRTIKKILEVYGVKRTRSHQIQFGKNGSTVFHNCLDQLTPEALYWIGFLYADGHVDKDRPRITLTLAAIDIEHLNKFKQFFGTGITTREVKASTTAPGQVNMEGKHYRVAFSSGKIYGRLHELGFTHNKTYGIIPHELLKNSRDFWRGVIDGDGWLFNTIQKSIGLCGLECTLKYFMDFINAIGVNSRAMPRKNKRRNGIWQIELHSHKAQRTADILYKDASVYLDRKYQKYLEFTPNLNQAA